MKIKQWKTIAAVVCLAGLALAVRVAAAKRSSPLEGDAWLFAQHGIALANGVPNAMSTYWSQGMIVIAAGAVRVGLDPRYVLQAATLVSGVAVVLLFAGVCGILTGNRILAGLGGLVVATNPSMVHYSITGF